MIGYDFNGKQQFMSDEEAATFHGLSLGCFRRYAFHQPAPPPREPLRETRRLMMRRPGAVKPGVRPADYYVASKGDFSPAEVMLLCWASAHGYHHTHSAVVLRRSVHSVKSKMFKLGLRNGVLLHGSIVTDRAALRYKYAEFVTIHASNGTGH